MLLNIFQGFFRSWFSSLISNLKPENNSMIGKNLTDHWVTSIRITEIAIFFRILFLVRQTH